MSKGLDGELTTVYIVQLQSGYVVQLKSMLTK